MAHELEAHLAQRGRASVDFLAHLARGMTRVRQAVERKIAAIVPEPAVLPDDLDQRRARMAQSLKGSRAWRVAELVGEWHAREHGLIAIEAFEEVRDAIEPVLRYYDDGPATLTPAEPGAKIPHYWDGVEFHRTAGGWDTHPYQGYVHGEIVHRKMVDALYPGGIFRQRRVIAGMPPREHYARILDMGCSTGHFTMALQESYPDAEIHGVDLSLRTLDHARRVANANGLAWQLHQRAAEDTGFAAASFDLVASYILLHELPADAIRRVFAEAFYVLKPGGDMIMSDVTRYADLDRLGVWRADHGAATGGEPHWRESASLDLGQVAREAGFVDVVAAGLPPMNYPYYVMARKPA